MYNPNLIRFDGLKLESTRPGNEVAAAPFSVAVDALRARSNFNVDNLCLLDGKAPIFDQLNTSTCVAQSTARALLILMPQATWAVPARLGIYYVSCAYTGDQGQDNGTYIHNAFRGIAEEGICPEADWAFSGTNLPKQPPVRAFRTSNEFKIQTWYQIIRNRLEECETAVRSGHPVVFGTMVGQELMEYRRAVDNGMAFGPTKQPRGLHAMCISGVRYSNGVRQWRVDNSWSADFGINGRFWMNDELLGSGDTTELFVPTQCLDLPQR